MLKIEKHNAPLKTYESIVVLYNYTILQKWENERTSIKFNF